MSGTPPHLTALVGVVQRGWSGKICDLSHLWVSLVSLILKLAAKKQLANGEKVFLLIFKKYLTQYIKQDVIWAVQQSCGVHTKVVCILHNLYWAVLWGQGRMLEAVSTNTRHCVDEVDNEEEDDTNTVTQDSVYSAVIVTASLRRFTWLISWMSNSAQCCQHSDQANCESTCRLISFSSTNVVCYYTARKLMLIFSSLWG